MVKKRLSIVTVVGLLLSILAGCMSQEVPVVPTGPASPVEPVDGAIGIRISGLSAGYPFLPVYIAKQKGWFEEEGLEVELVMYPDSCAQMESATDAWDIGTTDLDGVLQGTIDGRAVVFAGAAGDVGMHQFFARKGSAIVVAGKGHHSLSSEIYGDAASWKGVEILGPTGTILQMSLEKTLAGFGLRPDDVRFTDMEPSEAQESFLAGRGDVLMVGDYSGFTEGMKDDILVSTGNLAQTGIITNIVARVSEDDLPQAKEARKRFLRAYLRIVEWIREHPEETAGSLREFYAKSGTGITVDMARTLLFINPYFDLEDNNKMMNAKSENTDYSIMQAQAVRALTFLIRSGKYPEGSLKKFILSRYDATVVNGLLEETKQP